MDAKMCSDHLHPTMFSIMAATVGCSVPRLTGRLGRALLRSPLCGEFAVKVLAICCRDCIRKVPTLPNCGLFQSRAIIAYGSIKEVLQPSQSHFVQEKHELSGSKRARVPNTKGGALWRK